MGRRVVVQVLGPTGIVLAGSPEPLGSARQRRLLAALVLDAGTTVPADRLVDRVWADGEAPQDPRRALRTNLARLRQALGADDIIVTENGGWRFNPATSGVEIDASRFDELVEHAAQPTIEVHRQLSLLDEALGLWRGDAFAEVADEHWARAEATRLDELRLLATERRFEAMLAAGLHADATPGLAAAIETHPLRERLVGLQMTALFRLGRHAEAGRVFQGHRHHLLEDLGLEPGPELVDLDRQILAGERTLLLERPVGRPLRGYRVGEQIGEGTFSTVYRGTQPSLGRDVAIKVIRSDLANRPDFIRRFEAEAYLIAHLEHPHIVPFYDFWREPDRAYLVFRYLRGGTLAAKLISTGALQPAEARTLALQVGSALGASHRAGVVHRDVDPTNIYLDETGNFFLGDFGIALDAEPLGQAADVLGFGASLFAALTGRHLSSDAPTQRRGGIPGAVDAVLAKATAADAGERHESIEELVAEFVAEIDTAIGSKGRDPVRSMGRAVARQTESRNPYKGLRPFTEADSADFFGRERAIERLTVALAGSEPSDRIVLVVGPSGIGKSSLVRAGLLPAVRSGKVPGSERWYVASMMPGEAPFEELGAALLRVATRTPDGLMSQLREDAHGLARIAKTIVGDDSTLLLVVDQFEELFTMVDDLREVGAFLEALEQAISDARCPLKIVLTLRADFWDRPLRFGAFARLIEQSTVNLSALAPDELERAITEPAHIAGCEFERGLLAEITADVSDQPGALPLLQYALAELWDRREARTLTIEAYRKLGGVAGALSSRAEQIYAAASPVDRAVIRGLFERLVTPGEGTEDTRRRVRRSELTQAESSEELISRIGAARLLSFDVDPSTREPTVEVAHEALIRRWPRLQAWLDEDREGLRVLRHLWDASRAWDASGRDPGDLYRGGRLETAEQWKERNGSMLAATERAFLKASHDAAAELEKAEHRQRVRLRRLAAISAVVAFIALAAGAFAVVQQQQAEVARVDAESLAASAALARTAAERSAETAADEAARADDEASRAEVRRLVAESANQIDVDRRLAILIALEAHRADPSPETLGAVQRAMLGAPRNWLGAITADRYIAGGFITADELATISESRLDVWNIETRMLVTSTELAAEPTSIAVSTNGAVLSLGFGNGRWEVRTGDDVEVVVAEGVASAGSVKTLSLSSDGTRLAIGSGTDNRGVVELIDLQGGKPTVEIERQAEVVDLVFSPDDELVAIGLGATAPATVVDSITGGQVGLDLVIDPDEPNFPGGETIAWADDQLVVAGATAIVAFEARSGVVTAGGLQSATAHGFGSAATTADGTYVIGDGGIVERYNPETRRLTMAARDPQVGTMAELAANRDGSVLAILSTNGISLFSTDGRGTFATAEVDPGVPPPAVLHAEISEDGTSLVTGNPLRGPAQVWALGSDPRLIDTLLPYDKGLIRDDTIVLTGADDGAWSWALWRSGELVPFTVGDLDVVGYVTVALSPNEEVAVLSAAFGDPSVFVVDIDTSAVIADLPALRDAGPFDRQNRLAPDLEFTPDGQTLIVTTRNGDVFSYDTASWTDVGEPLPPEEGFHGIAFTDDGTMAVTVNWDEDLIEVRDPATLEVVRSVTATSLLAIGGENPDILAGGNYAVTSGQGGAAVWDLGELAPVGDPFPHTTDFRQAGVAREAKLLATTAEGRVVLWNIDTDAWPIIACRAAGRNFDLQEWADFGPPGTHRATCDQWPVDR